MSPRLARAALLALLAGAAPPAGGAGASRPAPGSPPPAPDAAREAGPPPLAERLAWNPWERTRAGIGRLEKGDAAGAATALDTAFRLRAGDPRAAFNAGTGRLAAGRPDAAAPLELAARSAGDDLAADAWYNLGNARLAGGDARGAASAFIETLRRASGRQDAKRNLELALRELARQQQQEQARQRPQDADSRRQREPGDAQDRRDEKEGQQGGSSRPDGSAAPGDDSSPQGPRPDAASLPRPQPGAPQGDRKTRLPDFADQPDLDAEQAAALLQAVENLERQQRRERALERARDRHAEDEDW